MFNLLIGVSALLAIVMIVVGGVTYMTTDVFSQKSSGRETITHALQGLLLVISSYMILYTVNPDLLKFRLAFPALPAGNWYSLGLPNAPGISSGVGSGIDYGPPTAGACTSAGGSWVEADPSIGYGTSYCQGYKPSDSGTGKSTLAEQQVRDDFKLVGVQVNANPCVGANTTGCTNVVGMNNELERVILQSAINMGCRADSCPIVVSGGTEGHPQGVVAGSTDPHAAGVAVDLRSNAQVDTYMRSVLGLGGSNPPVSTSNLLKGSVGGIPVTSYYEGNHWHIQVKR
jgi:hypothetical protein